MSNLWGVMWHDKGWLDGPRKHLIFKGGVPVLFTTRAKARRWVKDKFGYILALPDLKNQPHGWMPLYPVKVEVSEKKEAT